jgi:DNA polymerase III subunit gamma/tau
MMLEGFGELAPSTQPSAPPSGRLAAEQDAARSDLVTDDAAAGQGAASSAPTAGRADTEQGITSSAPAETGAVHAPDRRALYLRWRPGRFADVLGQEHVTRTLRNAVATSQVAHAYLFCGPRGTGKTSIARILFKAIACETPRDGDACDACETCRDVSSGRALDLVEIDAASNRGIDHIRDLREKVWISPSQAPRKMYILDEAHQLSAAAWDAFLKTLEEPPPHVVFVLATTEVHKVPATILSRCQRFDLGRIALNDLVDHLSKVMAAEGLQAEPAVLQRVARLAHGGVRDALSTLDQLVAYGGDSVTLAAAREVLGLTSEESLRATAEALARHDARAALEIVAQLAREGADLRQFLEDLVGYLRALLIARLGAGDVLAFEFGADEQAWLESQAGAWQPAALVAMVRRLSAVDPKGRDAGQLQVQLELALLETALDVPAGPVGTAPMAGGGAALLAPIGRSALGPTRAAPPAATAPASPPTPSGLAPAQGAAATLSLPAAPGLARRADAPPVIREEPEAFMAESPAAATNGAALSGAGQNGAAAAPETLVVAAAPPDGAPSSPAIQEAIVRHRWAQFMEVVAVQVPKAGIALEAATLVGLRGDELHLAFTNEFLQRTIEEDIDCRRAVEQVLAAELGIACRLRCGPADAYQPTLPDDSFLQQAVELFGATGVERLDAAPGGEEHQS